MRRGRPVQKLSSVEAAYIAGIIDGEGTVSLTRRHRNENRQLEVSVSNTDISLLQFLRKSIGAGRITRKRSYSDRHTVSGTYLISNRQALRLLAQIRPYLRTYKAKRAELVLQLYLKLTPRNGFYTQDVAEQRKRFVSQFLELNPSRHCRSRLTAGSGPSVR